MKKVRKIDSGIERRMCVAAVISTPFLQGVSQIWRPGLIKSPFVNAIMDWTLQYLKEYKKAPCDDINQLFESNSSSMEDVDKTLVESFLQSISNERKRVERMNVDYLLDETSRLLQKTSLQKLHSNLGNALVVGDSNSAADLVRSWNKIEPPAREEVKPLSDHEAIARAFDNTHQSMFSLPGAVGSLINPHAVRGGFITFLGPEKRGKTWWLQEVTFRGLLANCNVAFFNAGDMSPEEMIIRQQTYLTGRSPHEEFCGPLIVPVIDCLRQQNGSCRYPCGKGKKMDVPIDPDTKTIEPIELIRAYQSGMEWTPCPNCKTCPKFKGSLWYKCRPAVKPLTWRQAALASKRFIKAIGGDRLRMASYPTETLTLDMQESVLDRWERKDGWIADIVVTDYLDICIAENTRQDLRHQENEKWAGARRMSLRRHCLYVSASQATAASYDALVIKMGHTGNDKRKNAHVTAMFGLNQTEEEKEAKIQKVNVVLARSRSFSVRAMSTVLQCLEMGRPCLGSYF
ncbi:MAG: hypothetical protein ABFD63_14985 [Smithella sp.]